MKDAKNGFVSSGLIKIRDRFSDSKHSGEEPLKDEKNQSGIENSLHDEIPQKPEKESDREWRKSLQRRWDEFRLLKKDMTGKLSEILASVPEEIRIEEQRINELREALEKYASLLDSINTIDDSKWNSDNFSSDLGVAMKKLENARLEHIRLSAKLAVLQRESNAAESSSNLSFLPELNSLSLGQAFRLGMRFSLPLIFALILLAIILSAAIFLSLRG